MKILPKTYTPSEIEDKLYQSWMDHGYFHAEVDERKKPFCIVMPPPNITGQLHMGHALDNTMQDILIRFPECRATPHSGSRERTMQPSLRKLK